MLNLELLRFNLRRYFSCDKSFDGSVADVNARYRCLQSVFGALPWEVSERKFHHFIDWLPASWSVESKISHTIEWVVKEYESRPKPPIIY